MEVPTDVAETALPQGQQGPSALLPGPNAFRVYEASEGRAKQYRCSICHKGYAQRQGAWLHIRKVHNPNHCHLCKYQWARPYAYRNHLKKEHPGVDPDKILGKPLGSRRRATICAEHAPQQLSVSPPPAVQQDQHNQAESQPYPPSPAGARVTGALPAHCVSKDINSQSVTVYAEQTATMDEHAKERTEPMTDLDISHDAIMLPRSSPNPETGIFSTPLSHFGENYSALVPEDPVVRSLGPTHYSPFSDADIDAISNLYI